MPKVNYNYLFIPLPLLESTGPFGTDNDFFVNGLQRLNQQFPFLPFVHGFE